MPTHWTYTGFAASDDLEQGDILRPAEELRKVFAQVHPHFCDGKYSGFVVATQSCDLVRRKSAPPKATYINLAVIRPLAQVLSKIIALVADAVGEGVFLVSGKTDAKRLLERLFNQNEQALGLFFLHQDADSGIGEQSVAFLRVTVSLRNEHYAKLLSARTGRLNPEFRAKLGWLCGNLYSRPATRDWPDEPDGKKQLDALISSHLEEQIPGLGPKWLEDDLVRAARERQLNPLSLTPEQITEIRPKPVHVRAIDEIEAELSRVAPALDQTIVKKFRNRLSNNGKFKKLLLDR